MTDEAIKYSGQQLKDGFAANAARLEEERFLEMLRLMRESYGLYMSMPEATGEKEDQLRGEKHFLPMYLTGVRVVTKDGRDSIVSSLKGLSAIKAAAGDRVIGVYGALEAEYNGDDQWTIGNFQYDYDGDTPQEVLKGLQERARAALIVVEEARLGNMHRVCFDPTEDPVNRLMLKLACQKLDVDYDDTIGPDVTVRPMPKCAAFMNGAPELKGDVAAFCEHVIFNEFVHNPAPSAPADKDGGELDVGEPENLPPPSPPANVHVQPMI